jgi:hypothetical protein
MKRDTCKWSKRPVWRLALAIVLMGITGLRATAHSNSHARRAGNLGEDSLQLPVGTVLPVKLDHGFSSKNARVGQVITGHIMQEVPLPNAGRIPEGAKVLGTIVAVSPAGNSLNAQVSFRFDQIEIHHKRTAVVTGLRALASFVEVAYAQLPETVPTFGSSYVSATTEQIGGDIKYGYGGAVTDNQSHTVGTGTLSGVLVHVRAQPEAGCRGPLDGEDRLQALWVFSSDACGVYGINGVSIAHAGRTEPLGEILLTAATGGDVTVRGGSGMLLRVIQ